MKPKLIGNESQVNKWAEAIHQAKAATLKVPKGWMNIWQIHKKFFPEHSVQYVRTEIKILLGDKMETRKFQVMRPSGQIRSVIHYRIK